MGAKANGNGLRFKMQTLALNVALAAPFGLFWALQSGMLILSIFFFGLIAASMLLTIWKG